MYNFAAMFNFRFVKDYLWHRLTARNRHGIHSPFIYRLADQVIYDFHARNDYAGPENQRKNLLNNHREILVTDLGAGSQVNKNWKRQISQIARHALKPPRLAQLLYRIAAGHQPKTIIELGTCLGITTLYFQQAAPTARIYTLEGCPETAAAARQTFAEQGGDNIELLTGNFDDTLLPLINALPELDLVYIDGNHQHEATLRYFNWCLPKVHDHTLLIFDDIYWSPGMKQAWAEIKAHPQVTVTIDLFWIGLVYFKKGQVKEDFKIRF